MEAPCGAFFTNLGTAYALSFGELPDIRRQERKRVMLLLVVLIILILWLLGWLAFSVAGSFIHLLLVVALIVLIVELVDRRRPV
jgi:hypothetical protein